MNVKKSPSSIRDLSLKAQNMLYIELYPHKVQFTVECYQGCTADLHWWLAEYIGVGMYTVPFTSLGVKFKGAVRFRSSEDAVRFALSNPFADSVDMQLG